MLRRRSSVLLLILSPIVSLGCVLACVHSAAAQATAPTAAPDTLVAKGAALLQDKQYREAARIYETLTRRYPSESLNWVRLGIARQLGGDRASALVAYRKGIQLGAGPIARYNAGTIFAVDAMPDSAFFWLTSAVGAGFVDLQTLTTDHDLDALRADRRWPALVDSLKHVATPCMYRPESRAFDFWVGDWDVVNAQGRVAGESSVQLLLDGCALYENWSTGGTPAGKSLNSYNADLAMWQQFWTDQTGHVTEYRTSEWIDGSLRYSAKIMRPTPTLLHMTFTPVNKDLVRQFGEVSTDGGKTWTPQYDLYYHRRKS